MKKKKVVKGILIGLAVVAVIAIATLAYISMNEVHTREKVENIEEIDIISEENLMLTYTIYNTSDNQQCAMVGIFTDGSVYYFNYYCEYPDFFNVNVKEVTSVYYLGKISTLDLLKLNFLFGEVDRLEDYRGYHDPTDIVETVIPTSDGNIAQVEETMQELCRSEEKENEYDCNIFLENGSFPTRFRILVCGNRIWRYYRIIHDSHAIAAMEMFRDSWFYDQLVDLVYEEMYPEIDRNAVNVSENNETDAMQEPIPVEYDPTQGMYAPFRQMITDWNINGLTGDFLVEYLENYYADEAYYDEQIKLYLGEPEEVWLGIRFNVEEQYGADFSSIIIGRSEMDGVKFLTLYLCYDDSLWNLSTDSENGMIITEGGVTFTREEWEEFQSSIVDWETTYEEVAERLGHPGHIIWWENSFTYIKWWGVPLYMRFDRDGVGCRY